ncbi:hypothetical protein C8J56DRAFT_1161660 [Mycena floridula]|nr:hypothetical protein C8J56DRAFT_1161660 [Mycena floridula]
MDYSHFIASLDATGHAQLQAAIANTPLSASQPIPSISSTPSPASIIPQNSPSALQIPVATGSASSATGPARISAYQSPRLLGLAASSGGSNATTLANLAASTSGFHGMTTVGVSMPLGAAIPNAGPINVNQDRLEAAANHRTGRTHSRQHNVSQMTAATFPETTAPAIPQPRRRRPRTNAVRSQPRLLDNSRLPKPPGVEECLFLHPTSSGDTVFIRLDIQVHPERPPISYFTNPEPWERQNQIVHYQELSTAEAAFSEAMGLCYRYELPLETELGTLLRRVKVDMESHPHHFIFETRNTGTSALQWLQNSDIVLEPMEFVNHARPTVSAPIRLRSANIGAWTTPLRTLAEATNSTPTLVAHTVSNDSRFIIHLRLKGPTRATFALAPLRLGTDAVKHISELDDEQEDDECDCQIVEQVEQPEPRGASTVPSSSPPPAPAHEPTSQAVPVIPVVGLWENPFNEITTEHTISTADFAANIFHAATQGISAPDFRLTDTSYDGLGDQFINEVRLANISRNFTRLLSRRRLFTIIHPNGDVTTGEGIEHELLTNLLHDDKASICFSAPMRAAGAISTARLDDVTNFGSIIGVMLVYKKYPSPLGPLSLQYFLNNLNIHSLSESFVREWNPELHVGIRTIIDAGPDGDITSCESLLQSYCETSAYAMMTRGSAYQALLPMEVLYASSIGSQPPVHPEMKAFLRGFQLPTPNGFTLPDAIHAFPGGSQAFLATLSLSHITDFSSISDYLSISVPDAQIWTDIKDRFNLHGCTEFTTFSALMEEFLSGTGIPLRQAWNGAIAHFTPGLPLEDIDESYFRPRHFSWAVTGSPEIKNAIICGESRIKIMLVDKDDKEYRDPRVDETTRTFYATQGVFCIHTCNNSVAIPANHLLLLGSNVIQSEGLAGVTAAERAQALKKHIFHWFLSQTLNAIGKVSLL